MRDGVIGMSISVTPSGASASSTAWTIVGGAAIDPLSPMPFTPIGLVGEGVCWKVERMPGTEFCARDRIVEQRAGEQLSAVGIVTDLLVQGLRNALYHAAVDLALGQKRIDDDADVIDRDIVEDVDSAGLRVDFDVGHVHPGRRAHADGIIEQRLVEAGLQFRPEGGGPRRPCAQPS